MNLSPAYATGERGQWRREKDRGEGALPQKGCFSQNRDSYQLGWMSEIFYAGGTTTKDISANDLINDLKEKNANAFFVEDRNGLVDSMRPHLEQESAIILMGARDPGLEIFGKQVWEHL